MRTLLFILFMKFKYLYISIKVLLFITISINMLLEKEGMAFIVFHFVLFDFGQHGTLPKSLRCYHVADGRCWHIWIL